MKTKFFKKGKEQYVVVLARNVEKLNKSQQMKLAGCSSNAVQIPPCGTAKYCGVCETGCQDACKWACQNICNKYGGCKSSGKEPPSPRQKLIAKK